MMDTRSSIIANRYAVKEGQKTVSVPVFPYFSSIMFTQWIGRFFSTLGWCTMNAMSILSVIIISLYCIVMAIKVSSTGFTDDTFAYLGGGILGISMMLIFSLLEYGKSKKK